MMLRLRHAVPLFLILLAGCGGSSSSPPATSHPTANIGTSANAVHVLIVKNGAVYAYRPAKVIIKAGESVVWTNETDATHTVTALDSSFDSNGFDKGRSFVRAFTKPGTYRYSCQFHPYMSGTVVVQP